MKPHPDPHGSSHYDRKTGVLTITRLFGNRKPEITEYVVEWNDGSDFGRPALRLHKLNDSEVIEIYDQGKLGGVRKCSCPDYIYRGYNLYECKHLRAVRNEIKAGRLKVPKSVAH